jgi:hypothetical protein
VGGGGGGVCARLFLNGKWTRQLCRHGPVKSDSTYSAAANSATLTAQQRRPRAAAPGALQPPMRMPPGCLQSSQDSHLSGAIRIQVTHAYSPSAPQAPALFLHKKLHT